VADPKRSSNNQKSGADKPASGGPARRELTGEGPQPPPKKPPPGVSFRSQPKPSANPRRVRGGLKLKSKEGEQLGNWIGQRLIRVVEEGVPGDAVREGLHYGRMGQTRRLDLEEGVVVASVQGRRQRSYRTTLKLEHFTPEQRETVVAAMAEQSRYAAKLLAGEMPPNVEDLFAPLGLKLFPTAAGEVETTCDCNEPQPWCKHAVCVAALLAERMSDDPFLIFAMRGVDGDELIDSLRQRRSLAGLGSGPAPVHLSHVPGASDIEADSLESQLDRFWDSSPEEAEIATPIEPPEVSHPLLRRLGSSPFPESRFRFLGLMATCYDIVSERVLREDNSDAAEEDEPAA